MRESEPLIIDEPKTTEQSSLTRKEKRAIERASLKMSGVKRKYQ